MNTETPFIFSGDFNEKYLFVDPLLELGGPGNVSGPVLLAEEIKEYITKYGLLIANDFYLGNLKGASYSMRPDPTFKAWRFDENQAKVGLEKTNDENGREYYEVPENSLVYIRLLQKIRLPYYIIGRFNLKVSYTYKGLLLGTGPQVDPGYEAHLNIPLHNFTTKPIKIYTDKSFVSIDFVRTSPLSIEKDLPKSRNEFLTSEKYKDMRDRFRPQDTKKIERMEIEDYVESYRPASSLAQYVKKLDTIEKKSIEVKKELEKNIEDSRKKIDEKIQEAKEAIKKIESFRNIEIIALLVLLISWWGSLIYIDTRMESRSHIFVGEVKRIPAIEERINILERKLMTGGNLHNYSAEPTTSSGPSRDTITKDQSEKIESDNKDQIKESEKFKKRLKLIPKE